MHILLLVVFIILGSVQTVQADENTLRFALVPKQSDVPFFKEIEQGCMEEAAKLDNVECIYKGPLTSDFRLQDKIISDLIDQGVDGIAVSVINSEFLVHNSLKRAKILGIPVITFDSDLNEEVLARPVKYRQAYIGTDNLEMGRQLGEGLISLLDKGTFSIISGNPTAPNLNDRMKGLREVLSRSGWKEYSRSPVYIQDSPERALNAFEFMLNAYNRNPTSLDAVIAMGAFLQSNYTPYKQLMELAYEESKHSGLLVVSADTSPHQVKLLDEGLSNFNVGQNTHQMGSLSIATLLKIHRGFSVEEINYTSLKLCSPNRYPMCQLSNKDKDS